jgi:hypothetical protein
MGLTDLIPAPYFCRRKIACRPNRPIMLRDTGTVRLGLNLASAGSGAFVIAPGR